MPRFVNLCRKSLVENWKANVLRFVMMYGLMAIMLLWYGYLVYNYTNTLEVDREVGHFTLLLFLWCLWGFGCISASFTMEKMKTKTNRISMLMTPATPFEKYFSRWIISTALFLVAFLIAFKMADYTRVVVYSLIYPHLEGIAPVSSSYLVGAKDNYQIIFDTSDVLYLMLLLYFFVQSCFVLGSTIWPKNALVKTFVAGAAIVAIYALLKIGMSYLLSDSNFYYYTSDQYIDDELKTHIWQAVLFFFALFNWTLAYFRFKESEIINRM